MKTPTLPPYAPKSPLTQKATYAKSLVQYGPAPKGWRWRKKGERYESGDICACDYGWWQFSSQGTPIEDDTWPIATPVKVLVKRDSRGRFAPEVPAAKTLPDLGEKFRWYHGKPRHAIGTIKSFLKHISTVLKEGKSSGAMYGIFDWSETAQGFQYWSDRQRGLLPLSPKDLDYLRAAKEFFEKRIVELTPAPAPSPTVPELQAKISSLEAEVASLRRKIAGAKVTFPE